MTDPAVAVGIGRAAGEVLKGRRLLLSVTLAWLVTVLCLALVGVPILGLLAAVILAFSPVLWLVPLWLLPKAPGPTRHAAPFLLFAVPLVLVTSAFTMTDALGHALLAQDRANSQRRHSQVPEGFVVGETPYVRDQLARYETKMAAYNQGLWISAGGGVLAALLELLGLYCWTRRMPPHRWSIALLLALFGPAVAGAIYFFFAVLGFPLTA